jgi:hypothetical protein
MQAADERQIFESAQWMEHHAQGGVWGTADEIEAYLTLLRNTDEIILQILAARSGMPDAELRALFSQDAWLTAAEAKAKGFVDVVLPTKTAGDAQTNRAPAARLSARPTQDRLDEARSAYETLAAIAADKYGDQTVSKKPTEAAPPAAEIQTPPAPPPAADPPAATPAPPPVSPPDPDVTPQVPAPADSAQQIADLQASVKHLRDETTFLRAQLVAAQAAARPVSTQVGNPDPPAPAKSDTPEARFGAEFDRDKQLLARQGVTDRDQYIRSRKRDEGIE